VWNEVRDADKYDRFRFQGELLWQDYSRHWYALYGNATSSPVLSEQVRAVKDWPHEPWWPDMECMKETVAELHVDGWCVNQTRMWLASQHSVRARAPWQSGENEMFVHLLDGSRAANRFGWQWSAGTSRSRGGGFARQQVIKRAPDFCKRCKLQDACPIAGYAKTEPRARVEPPAIIEPNVAFGPSAPIEHADPTYVWLTAESLGDADPALVAHPELPVGFVFDESLLAKLRLSGKRLVFLAETLADLGQRRDLTLFRGDPLDFISAERTATTFAPVPGFRRLAAAAEIAVLHPWEWLRPPTPAYLAVLEEKRRPPSFKDFCRLTKPATA